MGRDWGHKNQIACINNVKIKLLADKYSFSYIDLFSPLYNIDTGEIYEEYTADGAHLTSEGYEIVTNNIKPILSNLLG